MAAGTVLALTPEPMHLLSWVWHTQFTTSESLGVQAVQGDRCWSNHLPTARYRHGVPSPTMIGVPVGHGEVAAFERILLWGQQSMIHASPSKRIGGEQGLSMMQEYFSLDIKPIQARCKEVAMPHKRLRINDFDPFNLRLRLPQVIKEMFAAHKASGGSAYVHCTAGEALLIPALSSLHNAWELLCV
jgi:hypothetical protein